MAVIDLHSHLVPGIDDGPQTLRDALEMARVAVAEGIATVACTPHIADRYPNRPQQITAALTAFRGELERADIPLRLVPGAEIAIESLAGLTDRDLREVSLGGGGRWLLVELPFRGWPLQVHTVLDGLEMRGFRVVLAHPERAESVQTSPDRLRDLVGRGALVQITAGSLIGEHGPRARRTAEDLLRNGMVHFIASDAHSATRRPPALREGLEAAAAVLRTTTDALSWMVDEGPRLVLAGEVIRPPRLGPAPRREPARPPAPARR